MKTTDPGELVNALIKREAGYVNDPNDSGGETNFGITKAVAVANGYVGPMRSMPRDTAVSIYTRLYWAKPGFDLVAETYPRVAVELFDTGVNMGPVVAITFLQRSLNALNRNGTDYIDVTVDGRIGLQTREALSGFRARRGLAGEQVLLAALNALQGERYIRLAEHHPKDESFLYGWLANRVSFA